MTEDDYISQLRSGWPKDSDASLQVIALADEAVRAFPQSPRLLIMRGNLIELGPETCPYDLEESLRSYRLAVEIDPHFAEGWQEIGHYYDAVLNDEAGARPYFERATALKREPAASPNGGPATRLDNSGAGGGPPSVS